jgi:hypothetical protein
MLAVNGFDGVSHYLRAGLITNLCSAYAPDPVSGCNANFTTTRSVRGAGVAGGNKTDQIVERTRLAAQQAPAPKPGKTKGPAADPFAALHDLTNPRITHQRNQSLHNATGGGRSTSPAYGSQNAQDQALDYLLGNDR